MMPAHNLDPERAFRTPFLSPPPLPPFLYMRSFLYLINSQYFWSCKQVHGEIVGCADIVPMITTCDKKQSVKGKRT
jgi:hypothetical protein